MALPEAMLMLAGVMQRDVGDEVFDEEHKAMAIVLGYREAILIALKAAECPLALPVPREGTSF